MLLTVTTSREPATDLGYWLHKNLAKCQSFELSFGHAHVFYPEATAERCIAALLLDVDPVGMVRLHSSALGERCKKWPEISERADMAKLQRWDHQ